jgi:hypothetical protein
VTSFIGFFSSFHRINLDLVPGEAKKDPMVADTQTIPVRRARELFDVTLEARLKSVQPVPDTLAQSR